jgi:hypothetical protein
MGSIKGIYKLLGMSKISSWLPAIVARVVAFPPDKVLVLVAILTTILNTFNFIFQVVINLYRGRRRGVLAIYIIA